MIACFGRFFRRSIDKKTSPRITHAGEGFSLAAMHRAARPAAAAKPPPVPLTRAAAARALRGCRLMPIGDTRP
ncbi:hypothetical protein, partial [Burkholderia pseudomallei]|uniref:hypothetical protein n=1 Tax=Burkholderia pseudomallei TaxID=28450 RepID=UPI001A9106C9